MCSSDLQRVGLAHHARGGGALRVDRADPLDALMAQAFFEQGGAQGGGADVSQQISGGIVQRHVKDGFQVNEGFNRPTGDGPR